jgi:hypothetical protein
LQDDRQRTACVEKNSLLSMMAFSTQAHQHKVDFFSR